MTAPGTTNLLLTICEPEPLTMSSLLRTFLSDLIHESSTSVIIVDNAKTPCLHLLSSRRGDSEESDDYRYWDEHDDDEFHRGEAARWSVRAGASPESSRKTCPMAPKRQPSDRRLLLTPPERKASGDPIGRKTARHGTFPCFASPSRDIPDIASFPSSLDTSK
jgi:hypothetical protein